MLATLVSEPFDRPGWTYEEKYDGIRILAYKEGRHVQLLSRNAIDRTSSFLGVAAAIAALECSTLLLDGEVVLFDKKRVSAEPNTKHLWIYDLRTNQRFTLKERPMVRADLDDFVACYHPENRHQREEGERFRAFSYEAIAKRDKANLDITWLRDESLEDLDNLPSPDVIAREIVEDLTAALVEFEAVASALEAQLDSAGER